MDNNWLYSFIERYYRGGYYVSDPNHDMYVGKFVKCGKLTPEQYKEITKQEYPNQDNEAGQMIPNN